MYGQWIKNAIRFGIDTNEDRGAPLITDEEVTAMATWLNKNPMGTYAEFLKEQST